jgi:hypothetical protein
MIDAIVDDPARFVGTPDIHDGYIREVFRTEGGLYVKVQGDCGRFYMVRFHGLHSIESETPVDMMLYGLAEWDTRDPLLRRYEFVNWYFDEPDTEESKSRLKIVAAGLELNIIADPPGIQI